MIKDPIARLIVGENGQGDGTFTGKRVRLRTTEGSVHYGVAEAVEDRGTGLLRLIPAEGKPVFIRVEHIVWIREEW